MKLNKIKLRNRAEKKLLENLMGMKEIGTLTCEGLKEPTRMKMIEQLNILFLYSKYSKAKFYTSSLYST